MMALPAGPLSGDASTHRKFYTLTASLREIYDDNINTTSGNKQSSLETQLTPSVLVDFPMENSDFSARYSLGVTYYGNSSNNSGGNGGSTSTIEYTNEFTAQYNHAFSGRFNLGLADLFRNYTEPSLFESTGTNYRNGAYNSNTFNGSFGAQMTPLLGMIMQPWPLIRTAWRIPGLKALVLPCFPRSVSLWAELGITLATIVACEAIQVTQVSSGSSGKPCHPCL
jgi:hypothetical protein